VTHLDLKAMKLNREPLERASHRGAYDIDDTGLGDDVVAEVERIGRTALLEQRIVRPMIGLEGELAINGANGRFINPIWNNPAKSVSHGDLRSSGAAGQLNGQALHKQCQNRFE
jgi:hypothetical protein